MNVVFARLPRLHSILFARLGSSFPLLLQIKTNSHDTIVTPCGNWVVTPSSLPFAPSLSRFEFARLRACFLRALKALLRNDELTAEYVLLACLSRVYGPRQGATPLGYLSTNFTGIGASAVCDAMVSSVTELVALVTPTSSIIDASVRADLHASFDESKGIMSTSPLQLPEGTVLFVDERRLRDTSNLSHDQKASLSTLGSVVEKLILPLTANYYTVDLPLDINTVVFSDSESILNPQLICPWRPNDSIADESQVAMAEFNGSLPLIRLWWSYTRLSQVVMSEAAIAVAENDFVNLRQVDSRLTLDDFHTWLCVSRLIAVSLGDSEITPDHWRAMRALERERLNRLIPAVEASRANFLPTALQRASPNTMATKI